MDVTTSRLRICGNRCQPMVPSTSPPRNVEKTGKKQQNINKTKTYRTQRSRKCPRKNQLVNENMTFRAVPRVRMLRQRVGNTVSLKWNLPQGSSSNIHNIYSWLPHNSHREKRVTVSQLWHLTVESPITVNFIQFQHLHAIHSIKYAKKSKSKWPSTVARVNF